MQLFLYEVLRRLQAPAGSTVLLSHSGRTDLQRSIRIKANARHFCSQMIVVHDLDAHPDCRELEQQILSIAQNATCRMTVRVVCSELESWFLGDLDAVAKAYNIRLEPLKANQAKLRDPDRLINAAEEFARLLKSAGKSFRKTDAASRIGAEIDLTPGRNRSRSFNSMLKTLCDVVRDAGGME